MTDAAVEVAVAPARMTVCGSRDEWLTVRQMGIGGSEAAAVLGVSPWRSRYQLWAEKRGLIPREVNQTDAMRWGLKLEPVVAAAYEEATGRKLIDLGPFTISRSDGKPFMFATHDRLIEAVDGRDGLGILSIKTTNASKAYEWRGGAPLHYQIQLQHEMSVSGARWGSFAVLTDTSNFHWFDVDRSEEFIACLEDECFRFWQLVDSGREPQIDASAQTSKALRQIYPQDNGETIALPADAIDWHRQFQEASAAMKAAEGQRRSAEEQRDAVENRLIAALGASAFGTLPGGGYSFKTIHRAAYSVKAKAYRQLVWVPQKKEAV